jgi:bifunctional non-homologous end joining protein LigD
MTTHRLPAALRRRLLAGGARLRPVRAHDVEPMLAGIAAPFSRAGWIFELKYDGFRMMAGTEAGQARLRFRSGSDATARFPEVAAAVAALSADGLVLDGEVVALDDEGRPDFQRLQKRFMLRRATDVAAAARALPCCLFAFDLLAADGLDLRPAPLRDRKEALAAVLAGSAVHPVAHVEEDGEGFFREVVGRGLEGLMAKRATSSYAAGRSAEWLKFRIQRTSDFVIVGFTAPGLGREGGLHLACRSRSGRQLVYAGRVGSGFDAGTLGTARELLAARTVTAPPCAGAVPRGRTHTWVEPRVVCEVRFLEQTEEGLLRHPVFVRFRPDKTPGECYVGEKEHSP